MCVVTTYDETYLYSCQIEIFMGPTDLINIYRYIFKYLPLCKKAQQCKYNFVIICHLSKTTQYSWSSNILIVIFQYQSSMIYIWYSSLCFIKHLPYSKCNKFITCSKKMQLVKSQKWNASSKHRSYQTAHIQL